MAEHLPAGVTKLSLNFGDNDISDEGATAIAEHLPAGLVYPNPATQSILMSLMAGETVHPADELSKAL